MSLFSKKVTTKQDQDHSQKQAANKKPAKMPAYFFVAGMDVNPSALREAAKDLENQTQPEKSKKSAR